MDAEASSIFRGAPHGVDVMVMTRAEYSRRYRERHPDRVKAAGKKWRSKNREKERATSRRHYAKNIEARREAVWDAKGIPRPTRPRPGLCEMCAGVNADGKALSLDHCHEKNVFRGWLCNKCNTGIGKLGDNLAGALRAVAYLEKNGGD